MLNVKESKTIVIGGESVAPGESKLVQLNISRLPTGTLINIPVHVFNSENPGPTILIQAGLHGDEINGVETVRRMLQEKQLNIDKGAIIAVPIFNIFGFIHFSRDVPDGKDVNRSFPGNKSGSLASRTAFCNTSEILPQVDFGIDLHTGGGQRHNFPQVRFTDEDDRGKELARIFNAPISFSARLINGSFRQTAFRMGIPTIVYEAGESMRFNEDAITTGIKGIKNILDYFGMLSKTKKPERLSSVNLTERKWVRASKAGMFIPKVFNGSPIVKGQIMGILADTYAKNTRDVKAPYDGYVFCINHQAVVNQGDALFHVGK